MTLRVETYQVYDPAELAPLEQITIDADINQDGSNDLIAVVVMPVELQDEAGAALTDERGIPIDLDGVVAPFPP